MTTKPDAVGDASPAGMVEWKWFGYPGHFIGSSSCQFRMCTQVGGYLISTVGDYRPDRNTGRKTIGAGDDAFFETYVFRAGAICAVEGCGCGMPDINGSEIDGERTATAGEAAAAHMKYCAMYAALAEADKVKP